MRRAVVLDDEALVRVVEVDSSNEGIAERGLGERPRKACQNELQAQSRLHRTLAGGLAQLRQSRWKLFQANESFVQGHVGDDHCLHQRELSCEVRECAPDRRDPKAATEHDVVG